MAPKIGSNRNTNEIANVKSPIATNATTSVKIADANPNRLFFHVNNDSELERVWIKLQPAADDNDKKGIMLSKRNDGIGTNSWEMPVGEKYTGEICAISDSGTPNVYVTEY